MTFLPISPKVTLAKDGKPSIDMNGYKGSDTLVSQDLIKGEGAEVRGYADRDRALYRLAA